jgi:hypothetical protein
MLEDLAELIKIQLRSPWVQKGESVKRTGMAKRVL